MNSFFRDHEPIPLVRTFDQVPVIPRLLLPHGRLISTARSFGLNDMPETVEAYLRLSNRARSQNGQRIDLPSDDRVTVPTVELEIDATNVRSVAQEVASGALLSWTLYNNRVVRVPWTRVMANEPEAIFSGEREEGAFRLQRVLPQEAYLILTDSYVGQLYRIQNWVEAEFGNLMRFLNDSEFNPNPH